MSDDFGIGEIAALVSALAAAAGAATSIATASKGAPKISAPTGPTKADLAAQGALRPELFGSATPGFRAGLQGGGTGPLPGAGGSTTQSLTGGADEFSKVLAQFGGGQGGGGTNSPGGASIGSGGLGMGTEGMDVG